MMFQPTFFFGDRLIVIAPECMGYRSAIAMLALAVGYSICKRLGLWASVRLVLAALGLAVAGNVLRIASVLLLALWNYDFAVGWWHEFFGYAVVFPEVFIMAAYGERLPRGQSALPSGRPRVPGPLPPDLGPD